jgi:hypothetical protein
MCHKNRALAYPPADECGFDSIGHAANGWYLKNIQ